MHRIAISNSHRLDPRPRPGTRDPPRDIIVKFVRFRDRALVYSNKRNLKSYNQNPSNSYKISVNEALTTKRAKLRRCRLDQLIQSCWTYKGNLFVKNPLCQQWKKKAAKMLYLQSQQQEIVTLNVGGTLFQSTKTTLHPF